MLRAQNLSHSDAAFWFWHVQYFVHSNTLRFHARCVSRNLRKKQRNDYNSCVLVFMRSKCIHWPCEKTPIFDWLIRTRCWWTLLIFIRRLLAFTGNSSSENWDLRICIGSILLFSEEGEEEGRREGEKWRWERRDEGRRGDGRGGEVRRDEGEKEERRE